MSKELTVEADDFYEAIKRAHATMGGPVAYSDLTPTKLYFEEVNNEDK